jgi:hypothetical protein
MKRKKKKNKKKQWEGEKSGDRYNRYAVAYSSLFQCEKSRDRSRVSVKYSCSLQYSVRCLCCLLLAYLSALAGARRTEHHGTQLGILCGSWRLGRGEGENDEKVELDVIYSSFCFRLWRCH